MHHAELKEKDLTFLDVSAAAAWHEEYSTIHKSQSSFSVTLGCSFFQINCVQHVWSLLSLSIGSLLISCIMKSTLDVDKQNMYRRGVTFELVNYSHI